jgi:hypothetical protein
VVLLEAAANPAWEQACTARGWRLVRPDLERLPSPWTDPGVSALEVFVRDHRASTVYLISEAAAVFYPVSRAPDLWNAAIAVGGDPRAAIVSNKLFGANTQLTPVLWVSDASETESWMGRLKIVNFNVTLRKSATIEEGLDWLAAQRRDPVPPAVDCETGNPRFARCFWLEATELDSKRRNDVLGSTRVPPGSGAYLALGGFGFETTVGGPGVLVGWLPPKYAGPLKLGDRIVSIAGREIRDAADYARFMDEQVDTRSTAVIVLRAKQRVRMETRIVLPERQELSTARMQGTYTAEQQELLVITRGVKAFRLRVHPDWNGAAASWNGEDLGKLEAGCWEVDDRGARKCPQVQPQLQGRPVPPGQPRS